MKTKRSTECAVLMGLGACHGCASGSNLAFHVDFRPQIHRVRIFCGGQPGLGVDTAQQIIAEVGVTAATFPSEKHLSSWVGACPGDEESAEVNRSRRSPQGNRHMRRILNQAANAAAKLKGSIFEILYRRYVPRLGHNQTIGIIAHKLCRLVWKILHRGIRYEERGPEVKKRPSKSALEK